MQSANGTQGNMSKFLHFKQHLPILIVVFALWCIIDVLQHVFDFPWLVVCAID